MARRTTNHCSARNLYKIARIETKLEMSRRQATLEFSFRQFGYRGSVKGRDIWASKYLGTLPNSYKAHVPPHGVVLLRISE